MALLRNASARARHGSRQSCAYCVGDVAGSSRLGTRRCYGKRLYQLALFQNGGGAACMRLRDEDMEEFKKLYDGGNGEDLSTAEARALGELIGSPCVRIVGVPDRVGALMAEAREAGHVPDLAIAGVVVVRVELACVEEPGAGRAAIVVLAAAMHRHDLA